MHNFQMNLVCISKHKFEDIYYQVIVPNSIGEAYALLQSIGKRAWHLPR
jgi:hypothetical protein